MRQQASSLALPQSGLNWLPEANLLPVRGLGGERVPVRSQPGDWQLSPASPPVFPQETEQLLGLPVSLQGTAELQAAWEFV